MKSIDSQIRTYALTVCACAALLPVLGSARVASTSDFAIAPTFDTALRWSVQATGGTPQINPTLHLARGSTYVFDVSASAVHPFFINTSDATGSSASYAGTGLSANGVTTQTAITFAVPADAPDQLFYNCGNHSSMAGRIDISIFRDSFGDP